MGEGGGKCGRREVGSGMGNMRSISGLHLVFVRTVIVLSGGRVCFFFLLNFLIFFLFFIFYFTMFSMIFGLVLLRGGKLGKTRNDEEWDGIGLLGF